MGDDDAFINETLIQYCTDHGIEFTRSRAYRSNDQAWIEQENGSVVRLLPSAMIVTRAKSPDRPWRYLYGALRRYVTFLQPSFKLIDQADRQDPGRRHLRQALQPAHHALRPADPA